jgi:hypothetical protein
MQEEDRDINEIYTFKAIINIGQVKIEYKRNFNGKCPDDVIEYLNIKDNSINQTINFNCKKYIYKFLKVL